MAVHNLSGRRSRREKWLGDPESLLAKWSRWVVGGAVVLPPALTYVVVLVDVLTARGQAAPPTALDFVAVAAGALLAVACFLSRSLARAAVVAVLGLFFLGFVVVAALAEAPALGKLLVAGSFVASAAIVSVHDVLLTAALAEQRPRGRAAFRGRGDEVLAAEGCTVCDRVVCARPTPDEIDELGPLVPPVEPGRRWPAVAAVAVVALASGALLARRRG